jgi:hypothetical protein
MTVPATRGGPWNRLTRRLHLTAPALVLGAWIPSLVPAAVTLARTGHADPLLVDPAVHARLLIALPLVIVAERALARRCRGAVRELRAGRFAHRAELDEILDAAARLRDAWSVEVVLAVLAFGLGQASLWGWLPSGFVHGLGAGTASLGRVWYTALALPLLQFLWVRWLWRWLVWCYVLVRVARLRLALVALHPDNAAGLGFLAEPVDAFAVFAASMVSVAGAGWLVEVHAGVSLARLAPIALGFFALALVVAFGPLLLFAGHLYRALRHDLPMYRHLGLVYVREFRRKWLRAGEPGEPLLGTSDLQSLNDLGGAFEITARTRFIPVDRRALLTVTAAIVVPLLPVVLAASPLDVVFAHLGKVLLPI